jgi:double-stranded uracil-DNA glycosylase
VRHRGFAAIRRADAQLLILGTMPGRASLEANQYYAHPRNAFWKIAESVLRIPRSLDYQQRVELIRDRRIAIWDVLQSCERTTSLDSDIEADSLVANDFRALFAACPTIRAICFNGAKAGALYRRHVIESLPVRLRDLPQLVLPSTSPANARLTPRMKAVAWSVIAFGSGAPAAAGRKSPSGPHHRARRAAVG